MKSVAKPRMIYQTDETRNKILAIARSLFTERGLFDTQMLDVASALGMSRTTLYRYYQDKLDLALSVMQLILPEVQTSWHDPGAHAGWTALQRAGLYLTQVWGGAHHAPQLRYLAEFDAFFSGARIPQGFREKLAASIPPEGDPTLWQLLNEAKADGSLRSDVDLHLTMTTLLNTVRGLQQRVALRGEVLVELRPEETGRLVDEAVRYLLRGLAP